MTMKDTRGLVTLLFYLLAVPLGIGAFTHGALWLAVLATLALPLLVATLLIGAVVVALVVTSRPTRVA